ncbi:hypothetical protein [Streptomyces sp. NBC_00932]|uniref:hypothetical protein n=1 Tax=Streptomyces sp. NBC_00932 TaxID=2903690 RepID=UPI0038669175|nr:hypothetical protein OG221_37565 [Streptomyces sp. NBC_00932]
MRDRVYGWSLPVFTTVLLAGADCWLGFQFGEAAGAWGGAGAGVVISVVLRLFVSRATAGGGGGLHRLSSRWWHGRR